MKFFLNHYLLTFHFGIINLELPQLFKTRFEPCDLEFEPIPDISKIYTGAPEGLVVLQVAAYDPNHEDTQVTYNILDVKDHKYFSIDQFNGKITNNQVIDFSIDHKFELLVVALAHGQTEIKNVLISVVKKNKISPKFKKSIYKTDLLKYSAPGTNVIQVTAVDEDGLEGEGVIYHIEPDEFSEFSSSEYFMIDNISGTISIAESLSLAEAKNLTLDIIVEDKGSPKLFGSAKVNINLKTISAPKDVSVEAPNESSVKICWQKPEYGYIEGYNISYERVPKAEKTIIDIIETGRVWNVKISSRRSNLCYVVEDLRPWSDYKFSLFGWNKNESGFVSPPMTVTTRPDLCILGVCKDGSTCETINTPPGYKCHCEISQYGKQCQKFNPCKLDPCENFGKCSNKSDGSYICECQIGFYGRNCSDFNPCAQLDLSPCQNGATCYSNETNTYDCFCTEGYYGKTCEGFNPCVSFPCLNAGNCYNDSNENFTCECQPGFEGELCETNIDDCVYTPCQNNGVCVDKINDFECLCDIGFSGKLCDQPAKCQNQELITNYGDFIFPSVNFGVVIEQECPFGSIGKYHNVYSRYCSLNKTTGDAEWSLINISNCKEKGHDEATAQSRALQGLTSNPHLMTAEQLGLAVNQCEKVVRFAVRDEQMAKALFSSVSNLMEVKDSVMYSESTEEPFADRLIGVVKFYSSNTVLKPKSTMSLKTNNIQIELTTKPSDRPDGSIHFKPKASKDDKELSIKISSEALRKGNSGKDEQRVNFVLYNTNKFFRDQHRETNNLSISLPVIEANVNSKPVSNLSSQVIYTVTAPIYDSAHSTLCVYWIPQESRWSSDGLETVQNGNRTTCYSSHLTSFSILIDPTPHQPLAKIHTTILSFITYIGCLISLVGLLLTILTYSLFRTLNKDRQGRILLNLCISMAFMNISFILGAFSKNGPIVLFSSTDLCLVVSVLLHYFLLTSLCWMCVEAVNMYKLIVRVFTFSEPHFLLKRCIAAWGVPAILVGTLVGIDLNYYRDNDRNCMLSPNNQFVYFIGFFGPCCLLLFVNLVVFLLVCKVLCSPRMSAYSNEDMIGKRSISKRMVVVQVKGAFTVMVLLGVTWVFGAFAIGEAKLLFQYVFCISNSLQGFLIFVIRCLSYSEARKAWWHLLTTGNLRRIKSKRPTIASNTNSNSLQYKPSQNGHNSVKTTNSDSTISTLIFNNSCSWGRSSRGAIKCPKQLPINGKLSGKPSLSHGRIQDVEKLYAKPNKRLNGARESNRKESTDYTVEAPPVPNHLEFGKQSELERTLRLNDLTSDSDVGMIDDKSDEDNSLSSPAKVPGGDNWILKSSSCSIENNNTLKNIEKERDLCEVKQGNKVILKDKKRRMSITSIKSASNLKRHTSIITVNRSVVDELRAKSQSTPNIFHGDESSYNPLPAPVFPKCNISNSHTNVINIKLGTKDTL